MSSANQASAVSSLRTINTAETTYADAYKIGFSPTLAELGPGPAASASTAGLIDSVLAGGRKSGYTFAYTAGPKDASGHVKTYTVVAGPANFGGRRIVSYFTDESGVIRQTDEDRPATAKDPPVGG